MKIFFSLLIFTIYLSYPDVLVIPEGVADDTIAKAAKNYRQYRIPVGIWQHKKTKGVLLRSGAISSRVLSTILKSGLGASSATAGVAPGSMTDDEKIFTAIGMSFLKDGLCIF